MDFISELVLMIAQVANLHDREINRRNVNRALASAGYVKINPEQVETQEVFHLSGPALSEQDSGERLPADQVTALIKGGGKASKSGKTADKATTTGKTVHRTQAEWNKAFQKGFDLQHEGARRATGKRAYALCKYHGLAPTTAAKKAVEQINKGLRIDGTPVS